MLRQMYQMFLIPALWQTGDAKNEILLEIGREILPEKFFHYELHIADIKITKNFQQKFQNISNSPWGVTQLLLGNNVKNSCIIKKYNSIFTKNVTRLRFQSRSNIGYYYFPPPPGPLRGFLALSCMEDYFLIEFSVCGGDIGPLSIFTDLGHRHLLGYCL